ncbi:MAG: DUF4167 domain-containing protein [Hyphomonadaceae bacterium]|nr:DUF4167 domain-containing protein [Hyphomonadaceae bacterium]
MKRQRGRNRRPGGGGGGGGGHQHNNNNPNRTMESNGPDTKVRGPAAVIYERYLQLARDAASAGDRVLSENYLQHADHYFRLVRSMQPAQPIQQQHQERFNDGESDGDEDGAMELERAEGGAGTPEGEEQPDVDFPQGQQQQNFDREGGGGRRRGRRNRFRQGGESEGGDGGEDRAEQRPPREGDEHRAERRPRADGEERRERAPREPRDNDRDGAREGFSDGPKPAFLRGGSGE